jgi:hypothetical protein
MSLPDLPLWGWILVIIVTLLALTLPFWMLIRLPYMQRIKAKAAARSKETEYFFWVLSYISYLILVWLVLWGYGAL